MKNLLFNTIITVAFFFGISHYGLAQNQITIEMNRENDGKKETFKKEYKSYEEMMRDPEYREWIKDDYTGHYHGYKKMFEKEGHPKGYMFEFDSEGDRRPDHHFPRGFATVDFDWDEFDIDSMKEEVIRKLHRGLSPNHPIFLAEEPINMRISEPTKEDFNGRAFIGEAQRLDLQNLTIKTKFPGEVFISFDLEKPTDIRLFVADSHDKQVFYASYSNKKGTIAETIPFYHVNSGKYLLEIKSGPKSWTQILTIEK